MWVPATQLAATNANVSRCGRTVTMAFSAVGASSARASRAADADPIIAVPGADNDKLMLPRRGRGSGFRNSLPVEPIRRYSKRISTAGLTK
jgi:hypothetical protein